jgi:hypothetical protein
MCELQTSPTQVKDHTVPKREAAQRCKGAQARFFFAAEQLDDYSLITLQGFEKSMAVDRLADRGGGYRYHSWSVLFTDSAQKAANKSHGLFYRGRRKQTGTPTS